MQHLQEPFKRSFNFPLQQCFFFFFFFFLNVDENLAGLPEPGFVTGPIQLGAEDKGLLQKPGTFVQTFNNVGFLSRLFCRTL